MRASELSIGWACRACICPQESTKKLVRHTIRPKCVRKRKMTRSKSSMLWTEFRQKFPTSLGSKTDWHSPDINLPLSFLGFPSIGLATAGSAIMGRPNLSCNLSHTLFKEDT